MLEFKSIPEMYEKEKLGIKNNTLRKVDKKDIRFLDLIAIEQDCIDNICASEIKIRNTETNEIFIRQIKDVLRHNIRMNL